ANISELGLESVGLNPNGRFLDVDERLRAGDGIWGIGDVTGKGMFTHVALNHSAIVASDILGKKHAPARYDALPRVTFTDPEVASVGMTEAQALKTGIDV